MGLRSLADGYVPPILDVSRLDRKLLVSNEESVAGLRALLEREGVFGGVSSGAVVHVARGSPTSSTRASSSAVLADGGWKYLSGRLLGRGGRRALDGAHRLVVVPAACARELEEHARREAPNEACGLVVLEDGRRRALRPGRNAAASPYRFELDVDPEAWFLEDEGYELAVFHSHLSSPPRPSRTDVENIGLWAGRPYLIYSLRTGELAAWRIVDGRIEPLFIAAS